MIILASEVKKISDSLGAGLCYQLKIKFIENILTNAIRGENFANLFVDNEIELYIINTLIREFENAGYNVKITNVANQIIFQITW